MQVFSISSLNSPLNVSAFHRPIYVAKSPGKFQSASNSRPSRIVRRHFEISSSIICFVKKTNGTVWSRDAKLSPIHTLSSLNRHSSAFMICLNHCCFGTSKYCVSYGIYRRKRDSLPRGLGSKGRAPGRDLLDSFKSIALLKLFRSPQNNL